MADGTNPGAHPSWLTYVVAAIGAGTSLPLFWYTRRADRDPRFILDLGLAYLVLQALGVGITWHVDPTPVGWIIQPTITWLGVMVLVFAAIVPNRPIKILLVGLLAVSMLPLGMMIAKARGVWHFDSVGALVLMHYPDYMMVAIAAVVAKIVTGLGQQVAQARELGSYQLGDLLGRGGMGEVYAATHRMLARPAAIKLIRPEIIAPGKPAEGALAITRFRREAIVAASLRSPNTVELYDFGVTDDQTFYIVMELLDGMTLDALVRQYGPVPANRTIAILRQVCESLEEAHARGLVHRDIKPANIHLGRLGLRHDVVKVLDFGLVKSVTTKSEDQAMETATGLMPGTPAYMAPEMTLGEAYDGQADLYALGCVGYFLLTGQAVFEGDSALQVIARHLNATPVPPSERLGAPVPKVLEQLILQCLAKRPEDRPHGAAELARALAEIDQAPWREADALIWWRTHDGNHSPAPSPA